MFQYWHVKLSAVVHGMGDSAHTDLDTDQSRKTNLVSLLACQFCFTLDLEEAGPTLCG